MTPYIILITGILSFAAGFFTGENLGYKRGAQDEYRRHKKEHPEDCLTYSYKL